MHPFLRNLLINLFLVWPLATLQAQAVKTGIIQYALELDQIAHQNIQELYREAKKSPITLADIKLLDEVYLNPSYLSSLLFFTPSYYFRLGQNDQCSFYDLMISGALRDKTGKMEELILDYHTPSGKIRTFTSTLNNFKNRVIAKKCPQSIKFAKYFNAQNIFKTLKKFQIIPPSTAPSCEKALQEFTLDVKSPYLCRLAEEVGHIAQLEKKYRSINKQEIRNKEKINRKIQNLNRIKNSFNPKALSLLSKTCINLERPKLFCHQYFEDDPWAQLLTEKNTASLTKLFCPPLATKKDLTLNDAKRCVAKMREDKDLCRYPSSRYPSLVPGENCHDLAKLLIKSGKQLALNDCPGVTSNSAITTLGRLLGHIDPQLKTSAADSCQAHNIGRFAQFNTTAAGGKWGVNLCYYNKVNEREQCFPAIMAQRKNDPLSMPIVTSKIIQKVFKLSTLPSCRMLELRDYNPLLLEFKNGCFILYRADQCHATQCKTKILYQNKEVLAITQKQDALIQYFPINYSMERYAQTKIIEDHYRNKKVQIRNISKLKEVLREHKSAVIHGIGCQEDLLPSFFKRKVFAQCTPLAFMVDSIVNSKGKYALILKTGYDQINTPRLIPWAYVHESVKQYQLHHPVKLWSLYGVF